MTPENSPTNDTPANDKPAGDTGWERQALERLVMAQIAEQREARRWRIGFRFFLAGLGWRGFLVQFEPQQGGHIGQPVLTHRFD